MNDNEMNTVTEGLAENTSEVVEEVVKQSFVEKHPYLATIGTGALIGSGLCASVVAVRFAVKGGQMLYGKIKEKIKDRKEAKNQSDNVDEIDE